jgi:hypothetical protein
LAGETSVVKEWHAADAPGMPSTINRPTAPRAVVIWSFRFPMSTSALI